MRSAPDPLALYVRVGRNDHAEFLNLLATGDAACFGTVFDPTYLKRHQELRHHSPRTRGLFGCNDTRCCPRGIQDMLQRPARHFLYRRMKDISALGLIPERMRPQVFLEQHVRPASDRAVTASNMHWQDEAFAKKTRELRKRLDALRTALGHEAAKTSSRSYAYLPKTRAARDVEQRGVR